jgi:hypothetical protein
MVNIKKLLLDMRTKIKLFPFYSLIVTICVSNLSSDFIWITLLLTLLILLFCLYLGVNRNSLVITAILFALYLIFSQSLSLSLIFPLIAFTLVDKIKCINNNDYIFSSIIILSVILLKSFFDLDDYFYFDRNHIGLICAFFILTTPKQINRFINFMKIMVFCAALTLFSRNFMLFTLFYLVAGIFQSRKYLLSSVSIFYPLAVLLLGTLVSVLFSLFLNLDIFDSEAKNDYDRLIDINDESNKVRILALLNYFNYLSDEIVASFIPTKIDNYSQFTGMGTAPHNTLFAIIFNYGILIGLMYLLYIGWLMKLARLEKRHFLIFIPYYMILGGVLFGPALMLFFISHRNNQLKLELNRFLSK